MDRWCWTRWAVAVVSALVRESHTGAVWLSPPSRALAFASPTSSPFASCCWQSAAVAGNCEGIASPPYWNTRAWRLKAALCVMCEPLYPLATLLAVSSKSRFCWVAVAGVMWCVAAGPRQTRSWDTVACWFYIYLKMSQAEKTWSLNNFVNAETKTPFVLTIQLSANLNTSAPNQVHLTLNIMCPDLSRHHNHLCCPLLAGLQCNTQHLHLQPCLFQLLHPDKSVAS